MFARWRVRLWLKLKNEPRIIRAYDHLVDVESR